MPQTNNNENTESQCNTTTDLQGLITKCVFSIDAGACVKSLTNSFDCVKKFYIEDDIVSTAIYTFFLVISLIFLVLAIKLIFDKFYNMLFQRND